MNLMHRKQPFSFRMGITIQSNAIQIKECIRHILKTHGLDIIMITMERFVHLS